MKEYKRLTIKEVKKALKYDVENALTVEEREDAVDALEALEFLNMWLKDKEKDYKATDAKYGVSFKEYLGIEEERPNMIDEGDVFRPLVHVVKVKR